MFCYQCEETGKGKGCTKAGVCGKQGEVADLQDLLIYLMKVMSICNTKSRESGKYNEKVDKLIMEGLFSTITNANFDKKHFLGNIHQALKIRDELKDENFVQNTHDSITWHPRDEEEIMKKAEEVGVLNTKNEDIRSLRELFTYGLKGIAAYYHHAYVL